MRAQGLYPEREPSRIDYELMRREHPKLKAALTRAQGSGDPRKVAEACDRALNVWRQVGCWPDDWSRWKRALEDAWNDLMRQDDDSIDEGTVQLFRRVAVSFDV